MSTGNGHSVIEAALPVPVLQPTDPTQTTVLNPSLHPLHVFSCRSYASRVAAAAAAAQQASQAADAQRTAARVTTDRYNVELAARGAAVRDQLERTGFAAEARALATLSTRGAGMGLLAEDARDGVSALHPHRVRPDHYRGLPHSAQVQTASVVQSQAQKKRDGEAARRQEELDAAAQAAR